MNNALVDQRRAEINNIEDFLKQLCVTRVKKGLDQPIPYINTHHFAEGLYVRAYYGVKDSVATSQIHKREHITVLCAGHCRVVSTSQSENRIDIYKDFAIMVTPPLTQRALYFLEDTTIITVHTNPDNIRDMKELENMHVMNNFEEKEE